MAGEAGDAEGGPAAGGGGRAQLPPPPQAAPEELSSTLSDCNGMLVQVGSCYLGIVRCHILLLKWVSWRELVKLVQLVELVNSHR